MMVCVRTEDTYFFVFHGATALNWNILGHSTVGLMSERRSTKGTMICVLNIYIYAPLKLPLFFYECVVHEFWRSVLKKIGHMPTLFCVSEGTEGPCAWGLSQSHKRGSAGRAQLRSCLWS